MVVPSLPFVLGEVHANGGIYSIAKQGILVDRLIR